MALTFSSRSGISSGDTPRHILKHTDHRRRNIVTENIQLEKILFDLMIIKMRGHRILYHAFGRMHDGTEFVNFSALRNDDHASRMLPGRLSHSRAAESQSLRLTSVTTLPRSSK